jgi:putative flippase GtrA
MYSLNQSAKKWLAFLTVGSSAALMHEAIVIGLVEYLEWTPLFANIIGFVVAFNVSYIGHKHYTFNSNAAHRSTLPKFALVASSSFLLNQGLFFVFLTWTTLPYSVALFIVLGSVALLTYVLSHFWAFKQ